MRRERNKPRSKMRVPSSAQARRIAQRRIEPLIHELTNASIREALIRGYLLGAEDTYTAVMRRMETPAEVLQLTPPPEDIVDGEILS